MNNLDKLNRLRQNAGKPPLAVWKGSSAKLEEKIREFEEAGISDVLPGANTQAAPVTEDPEVKKNLKTDDEAPSLADSAMSKNVANPEKEKPKEKPRAKLARGLDTDPYARHSRKAVQDHRAREAQEKKDKKVAKVKLSKTDKRQVAEEAKARKGIAGAIDPKKDPAGAARQRKHVEDKQAARANKPKKQKNGDEITVAEIARELDMDPKVARAKLRRHETKIAGLHTKGQDRWTFPSSAKKAIVEILK